LVRRLYKHPVEHTAAFLGQKLRTKPRIALVLGSGLGQFAEKLSISHTFNTSELPHYPALSVEGHSGKIHIGCLKKGSVVSPTLIVFQGRVHLYESGSLELTTFPIELASTLGTQYLIVTNAAGGINRDFKPGDFMLIDDLLSLSFLGVGKADARSPRAAIRPFRHRVPPFDPGLQRLATESARELGIEIRRGVYCWLKGPSYETPAEIELLSRIGVDAVGMSTVPEVIRGVDLGMKVVGISFISNLAAGIQKGKLSHAEVTATGELVRNRFEQFVSTLLLKIR
jgi:purine-nucleoside phosphorylase